MRIRVLAALCMLAIAGTASAQTNVVTNGSFETSATALTGWSTGPATTPGGTGTCGFNAAAAPGTETATGTAGFAAAQGSNISLGSTATNSGANYDCVFYQDVAIPVGAVTATFSGSWGVKLINGLAPNHGGVFAGIYPTTKVPNYLDSTLVGSRQTRVPAASDTTFATFTDTAFSVSSVAGTTVRLALHIVTDQTEGKAVGGFDNIQLLVTTAYRVTYNGNSSTGGSVPVDNASYATGATVTVKANTGSLVRTGYVFNGWNTAADGSGTSYAATGAATFSMGAANVTLYAQWTAAPADLSVTKTQSTAAPIAGTNLTYTLSVTNNGAGDASTVSLSDPLPANTTFVSATAPAGWTATPPAVGANGTYTATRATLANGSGAQTFTITVAVSAEAVVGSSLVNTATVSSTTTDPTAANNTSTVTATVAAPVPTMGEWAMIIMAMLFATAGVYSLKRRKYGVVR